MEKLLFFCLLVLVQQTASVKQIYKLSKEDYARMPPKINLDRYEHCLNQPNGVFCSTHADVVSDGPSELLDMMRGYSAHVMHFNYTKLLYGLCLTRNCQPFFNGSHDEAHLKIAAEACLNNSLSGEYGLKARVTKVHCYFEGKKKYETDWLDYAMGLLVFGIIALNLVGTVYDVKRDQTKPENPLLTAFSLRANWRQLKAPPSSDPHMVLLKPINGFKSLISLLVILGHLPLPWIVGAENPSWKENSYRTYLYQMFAHGHLVTMCFFVFSGLLLAYNSQLYAEKNKMNWKMIPKAVFLRFMRLTPINVISLLLVATWTRLTDYGPFWQEIVGDEVHDCRNYWLYNIFYVNNFIDHSQCILQSWYLACDLQLHIVGLLVVMLAPNAKVRWWMLGTLYTIGVVWPGYHMYTKDLHGTLLSNPKIISEFYIQDPTFNWGFKRPYVNLTFYVIGIVFGYLIYDWQKRNVFTKDLTKYRCLYWMLISSVPLVMSITGILFCMDGPRPSMASRILFMLTLRPIYVTIIMLILLGAMFRIDNSVRSFLDWSGWTVISRLSYCLYAFHMCVIRYLGGTKTTLSHFSSLHLITEFAGVTVITFQVALVFYLFVEVPMTKVVKIAMGMKPPSNDVAVKEPTPTDVKDKDA